MLRGIQEHEEEKREKRRSLVLSAKEEEQEKREEETITPQSRPQKRLKVGVPEHAEPPSNPADPDWCPEPPSNPAEPDWRVGSGALEAAGIPTSSSAGVKMEGLSDDDEQWLDDVKMAEEDAASSSADAPPPPVPEADDFQKGLSAAAWADFCEGLLRQGYTDFDGTDFVRRELASFFADETPPPMPTNRTPPPPAMSADWVRPKTGRRDTAGDPPDNDPRDHDLPDFLRRCAETGCHHVMLKVHCIDNRCKIHCRKSACNWHKDLVGSAVKILPIPRPRDQGHAAHDDTL